ncbi:MAG TPA: glycosyltransferase family 39 protein [Bryobacteraceae bacterium]|nr:glycosyltransferase family 39 protein [Bryobacteraceae bacterium]
MEHSNGGRDSRPARKRWPVHFYLIAVLLFAAAIYLPSLISPPSLMDDVDAVQAQIARNMLSSGDWVTAHLDGIPYFEKAPLIYWLIAGSYKVFGVSDWAARIPVSLFAIALALLTAWCGAWAFGRRAGFYAGLCVATCVGLFLFTRIQIPDVMLTFTILVSVWSMMRALDEKEPHPRAWSLVLAASLGVGLLWKSLIGVVFPVGAGVIYLFFTKELFSRRTWQRLHPFTGALVALAIALPWHVLATIRNPPYFVFTMKSVPGQYHGFFWFYFFNEQLLRFLNLRYPRDYNTVPRLYFWLFHFLWLFPWSVYLPAVCKLKFRPVDRAGKLRLMALCLTGVVLVFFTFSTTQEYYSMPVYPALALLLGSAMTLENDRWVRNGTRVLAIISALAAIAICAILIAVRHVAAPGDISNALTQHPSAYTLSLGHMEDLTLDSFAYLRLPLVVAGIAFVIGAIGCAVSKGRRAFVAAGIMMVLFFQAARLALVVFDPYLSSRPLAQALLDAPPGRLIVDHHYYTFSSIFFYTDRTALLRNGRIQNLVYGSYAPGAPDIFIDDSQFANIWLEPGRSYIVADDSAVPGLERLVGASKLIVVARSGGKVLLSNETVPAAHT